MEKSYKETILCISNYNQRKSLEMKITYDPKLDFDDFLIQVARTVDDTEPGMFHLDYLRECFENCESVEERWVLLDDEIGTNVYPIPHGWDGVRMDVSFRTHCVTYPKLQMYAGNVDMKIRDVIVSGKVNEREWSFLHASDPERILEGIITRLTWEFERDLNIPTSDRSPEGKEARRLLRLAIRETLSLFNESYFDTGFDKPVVVQHAHNGVSKAYTVRFGTRKTYPDLEKLPEGIDFSKDQ